MPLPCCGKLGGVSRRLTSSLSSRSVLLFGLTPLSYYFLWQTSTECFNRRVALFLSLLWSAGSSHCCWGHNSGLSLSHEIIAYSGCFHVSVCPLMSVHYRDRGTRLWSLLNAEYKRYSKLACAISALSYRFLNTKNE